MVKRHYKIQKISDHSDSSLKIETGESKDIALYAAYYIVFISIFVLILSIY